MPAVEVIAAQEPRMRVLVKEANALRFRADGDQPLLVIGLGAGEQRLKAFRVRKQPGRQRLIVESRSGGLGGRSLQGELRVRSNDPRGIWLGSRRYRGELRVRSGAAGLQVVNHLKVESYLASVVGSEMPPEWPMAALQAQAVAARTFALRQQGKAGGFDVKASVASQVYLGVESETASTREAVASTRSLVLLHDGKLIDAVFHSSSGGATEASGAVWSQQLPYLVSVPDHDQHSPAHQWEVWFNPQQLRNAFRETGGVKSIDVLSSTGSGRVHTARVHGPDGDLVLTGKELRRRLGLKSTLVRFEMLASKSSTRASFRPNSSGSKIYGTKISSSSAQPPQDGWPSRAVSPMKGVWSHRTYRTHSRSSRPAALAQAKLMPPPPLPPLTTIRIKRSGRYQHKLLLAQGQGFGHGVGMSQWGAHGLAQRGADFRQILHHYYRGAVIRPYQRIQDPSLVRWGTRAFDFS